MTDFLFKAWWIKYYSVSVLTEDGIYEETQVPEDYAGPQVKFESVHFVMEATLSGVLNKVTYIDALEVMDNQKKKGLGIKWPASPILSTAVITAPTGPSDKYMQARYRENPFFADVKLKLIEVFKALDLSGPLSE